MMMPFVIGWMISAIATPMVNWLEKRLKIVKKLGSVIIVVSVLGLIMILIYFAVTRLFTELIDLIQNVPTLYSQMESGLREIGDTLSGVFARLPEGIQKSWSAMVANLDTYMGDLVTRISQPTVTAAGNFAMKLPSYLIATIVCIMSAYFFTAERDEILQWLNQVSPPSIHRRMSLVMDNLKHAVGGYFKAQFKIMGIIFLILFASFFCLGIRYAVLVAGLIAFLDFLPFFGTGTALIPWALYEAFVGDYKLPIFLFIIYIITQLVRQVIQPKLMGESMGLNPLVTLMLLYAGYKISSVIGMILAVPIGMVVINMWQAGAFDYILDDVKILVEGLLGLRGHH
jgi:sporulation integral membrane protein YtvI